MRAICQLFFMVISMIMLQISKLILIIYAIIGPASIDGFWHLSVLFNASLTENPDLCQMDPCHHEEKKKSFVVPVVTSIVGSVLILIFLNSLIVFCTIKRRRQQGMSFFHVQFFQAFSFFLVSIVNILITKQRYECDI